MQRFTTVVLVAISLVALAAYAGGPKETVVNSKHDFSIRSTATVRSSTEQRVCVFCHTSHDGEPNMPLWNQKASSATNYTLYNSSTLRATVGRPTPLDSSKLCLSCHDGTVALGSTMNNGIIPFVQGSNYRLPASAASNLHKGNGFADEHPFVFLPVTGPEIQNPPVNDPVKLDAQNKVQCVTCHDPHMEFADPLAGKFLVKENSRSAICLTCHTKLGWEAASHRQPADPANDVKYDVMQGAHTGYTGVSNNGCESCHRPHTPMVGQRLVKFPEEDVCFACHNGSVANSARNIQAEFQTKTYRHPVTTTSSVHDAAEGPVSPTHSLPERSPGAARHAECADCHDPHAANAALASPPSVNGYLWNTSGITATGSANPISRNQYEICFKCHADSANRPQYFDTGTSGIGFGRNPIRQTDFGNPDRFNTRLEFSSNVSWHPVIKARGLSTGAGGEVPSLRPYVIDANGQPLLERRLWEGSLIYCTDCHNNDTGRNLGMGAGPVGPHGSNVVHLLERNYTFNTPPVTSGGLLNPVPYSSTAYSLCDKCHDLDGSVVEDRSFPEHNRHVVSIGASCSTCHDGHGVDGGNSINNRHLINFDTAIVGPNSTGALRFEQTGFRSGSCYLKCHNEEHDPKEYLP